MQPKPQKLSDILINANKLFWKGSLYCEQAPVFHESTKCIILNDDRVKKGEEPTFAEENNLKYTLSVQVLKEIVNNVATQKPNFDLTDLLKAFNFYFGNQSFIKF
jgi:MinD superfamily P-loop ATPase